MSKTLPVEVSRNMVKDVHVELDTYEEIHRVTLSLGRDVIFQAEYRAASRAIKKYKELSEWCEGLQEFAAKECAVRKRAQDKEAKQSNRKEKRILALRKEYATELDAEVKAIHDEN